MGMFTTWAVSKALKARREAEKAKEPVQPAVTEAPEPEVKVEEVKKEEPKPEPVKAQKSEEKKEKQEQKSKKPLRDE